MNTSTISENEFLDFVDEGLNSSDIEIEEVGVLYNDFGDMFYSKYDFEAESLC